MPSCAQKYCFSTATNWPRMTASLDIKLYMQTNLLLFTRPTSRCATRYARLSAYLLNLDPILIDTAHNPKYQSVHNNNKTVKILLLRGKNTQTRHKTYNDTVHCISLSNDPEDRVHIRLPTALRARGTVQEVIIPIHLDQVQIYYIVNYTRSMRGRGTTTVQSLVKRNYYV